jgi:hypothetical protein
MVVYCPLCPPCGGVNVFMAIFSMTFYGFGTRITHDMMEDRRLVVIPQGIPVILVIFLFGSPDPESPFSMQCHVIYTNIAPLHDARRCDE